MLVSMTCDWKSTAKMPEPKDGDKVIFLIENGDFVKVCTYERGLWVDAYNNPLNPFVRIIGWTEFPKELVDSVTENNCFKYLNG